MASYENTEASFDAKPVLVFKDKEGQDFDVFKAPGNKTALIKTVRAATGWGLKEAHDVVTAHWPENVPAIAVPAITLQDLERWYAERRKLEDLMKAAGRAETRYGNAMTALRRHEQDVNAITRQFLRG